MSVSVITLLDPPPVTSYNITLCHQINSAIFNLTDYLELNYNSLPALDLDQSFHTIKAKLHKIVWQHFSLNFDSDDVHI